MKFPYGICDFYKIITNDCYYADRTDPDSDDRGCG